MAQGMIEVLNGDAPISRGDMNLLTKGITQKWDIPAEVFEVLPARMLHTIKNGSDKDATAAAKVMAAIIKRNDQIGEVKIHLHHHEIEAGDSLDDAKQKAMARIG